MPLWHLALVLEGSALQSLFRVAQPWLGLPISLALPLSSQADSYKNRKSLPQLAPEATQAHPRPARSFW